jgi:hypothetical protein
MEVDSITFTTTIEILAFSRPLLYLGEISNPNASALFPSLPPIFSEERGEGGKCVFVSFAGTYMLCGRGC